MYFSWDCLQICFSSAAQQAVEQQQQQPAAVDVAAESELADDCPADTAAAATGAAAAQSASSTESLQEQEQNTPDPVRHSLGYFEEQHEQQEVQAASCKWFPWAAVKLEDSPAEAGSPLPPATATIAAVASPAMVAGSTAVPAGRLGGIKGVAAAVTKI